MVHGSGMVAVGYILLATKFSMILEPYSLAFLPFASLTNRVAPFDRYCRGDCVLEEPCRAVVNDGVLAYQLHVYLGLVRQHFGMKIKRLVHKYQLGMLADITGATSRTDWPDRDGCGLVFCGMPRPRARRNSGCVCAAF